MQSYDMLVCSSPSGSLKSVQKMILPPSVHLLEQTERVVAHVALDTPVSLAWAATSCSYIMVWYVVYKSSYS